MHHHFSFQGEVVVEGKPYDIRYDALEFDGWRQLHWTAPYVGERNSLVWFTPAISHKAAGGNKTLQSRQKLLNDDERANRWADEHSCALPFLPPLQFRYNSTDALVINELLDSEKGSIYSLSPNTNMPSGFSLKNHQCVLDVGAHIGVFSRLAIAEGCQHIIAYEPEPSNFELLSQNLDIIQQPALSAYPTIELHSAAVAHSSSKSRVLVKARHENSGKENTWRHALEDYSQYVDRTGKMSSKSQQNELERLSVPCTSFFGSNSNSSVQDGALVPGVTFVKLDCEGAEIDILLSDNASQRSSWLDTTHLVVEWSMTKERRVDIFHKAMNNLRDAGFEVFYEGIGSWWDTDNGVLWPYPKDIIAFAVMRE
jgi:FkbM family methyltransferase